MSIMLVHVLYCGVSERLERWTFDVSLYPLVAMVM